MSTASLNGHIWPKSFTEFGRWGAGNGIACERCGLRVFAVVFEGELVIGVPIHNGCYPNTNRNVK